MRLDVAESARATHPDSFHVIVDPLLFTSLLGFAVLSDGSLSFVL